MSDIQLYLVEFASDKNEASKIAGQTASKLEAKDIKLVELVESLEPYLNSEDVAVRTNTMSFLGEVLAALPVKILSMQQSMSETIALEAYIGNLLNDFVLSRISNGAEGLGYSAKCLLALEGMGSLNEEQVVKIMNVFLENTNPLVQFQIQHDRFLVLSLIDLLMAKYRSTLESLYTQSEEFMPKFISIFDGEKDPRNLMVVFSILLVPMVEWDVAKNAQDLFEAVFNYFPITFRPPPNDPYGVTAQQLKARLQDCISSTSSFAPHAFPALLDKLDSTSINVKRDVLQAIIACTSRYGYGTIDLYSVALWDALKFEVLSIQEEDLAERSLAGLQEIARQLASAPHEEPLQRYLKPIAKECNEHLEDTPTKQSTATGKILSSLCKASPEVSDFLTKSTLPQLMTMFKNAEAMPRRRGLLEVWTELLKANLSVFGAWRRTGTLESQGSAPASLRVTKNELRENVDLILEIFHSNLTLTPMKEVSYRLLALEGLQTLCMIHGVLNDPGIIQTILALDEIVIREESYGRDELKAASIDALVQIAHQKPQLVIETAMPEFMARLPDSDSNATAPYVPTLEAFAKLSAEPQLFPTIVIRLKNKLYAAVRQEASQTYIVAILHGLLYAFTYGSVDLKDPVTFGKYYQDIVVPFITDSCTSAVAGGALNYILNSEEATDAIARICNVIMRGQGWVAQTEVCRNVYTLFQQSAIANVTPFGNEEKVGPTTTMLISTQLLAALQREAKPHEDISALLQVLIGYVQLKSFTPFVQEAVIAQISLIVNKFVTASQAKEVIAPFFAGSANLLGAEKTNLVDLKVALAILKGLVLRTDPLVANIIPIFLDSLSREDDNYGVEVARGLSTLLRQPDHILNKDNHCLVYALHKQRLFALTVPPLASTFRSADTSEVTKRNILIASSGILHWVPYQLARNEMSVLIPLLLQSLVVDDTEVKVSSIATFAKIVNEDAKLVELHVSSLITRLLDVATSGVVLAPRSVSEIRAPTTTAVTTAGNSTKTSPPKTRAAALACLAAFINSFRIEILLPYKQLVTRTLQRSLDDKRRAVRAEAVRCRRVWLNLGGDDPENDD